MKRLIHLTGPGLLIVAALSSGYLSGATGVPGLLVMAILAGAGGMAWLWSVKEKSRPGSFSLIEDCSEKKQAAALEAEREVRELRRMLQESRAQLERAEEEARSGARAKSDFLANISHEIRTPINGIIGLLALLDDARLSEGHRKLLQTAVRSANNLAEIVDNILEYARLEREQISFDQLEFDLRQVVEETADFFADEVCGKGVELHTLIPTSLPERVVGDPLRLRQVLTNLIGNAVKFTRQGRILVQLDTEEEGQTSIRIRFRVKDSGIGIVGGVTPQLFERFSQADSSIGRQYGGTGLGLSICSQLVRGQGGSIGGWSEVGKGAEFFFTLPFGLAPAVPVNRCGGPGNGEAAPRLVLLSTSEDAQKVFAAYLVQLGVTFEICHDLDGLEVLFGDCEPTETADDCRTGLEIPEETVVVIDGFLVSEMGSERLRLLSGQKLIRMVLLCYRAEIEQFRQRIGIETFLTRPVRLEKLRAIVSGRQRGAIRNGRKLLLVDDEPINRLVAGTIIEKAGVEVVQVSSGMEALELVESTRFDLILMDLHMPGMDGLETTRRIRSLEEGSARRRATIVALTANVSTASREACREAGMDDFLAKPVEPQVLSDRLGDWFADSGDWDQRSTPPVQEAEDDIWCETDGLRQVGGDRELLVRLIELFLERKGQLLGNIRRELEAGSAEGLRDSGHAFKGAVGHLGAAKLQELARKVEHAGACGSFAEAATLCEELERKVERLVVKLEAWKALDPGH